MRHRQRPIRMRAMPEVGEGAVEAIVSVYDLVYDVGGWWGPTKERIEPGAFTDSIADKPVIPLFWQHDWEAGPIGDATASETDKDLRINGQLYVDDPMVTRIWRSLKADSVSEWSIGYIALATQIVKEDDNPKGDDIEVVMKGQLCETSSCVMGANPGTETISVRRAGTLLASASPTDEDLETRIRKLFPQLAPAPEPTSMSETEVRRLFRSLALGAISEDDAVRLIARKGVE